MLHLPVFVVLHQGLQILLRLHADQFAPLLVLERHHVEVVRPALQRTPRLDAADRLIVGQRPGRHQVRVVHAAHDDRLIDIAFQKVHNHFLADARDVYRAPLRARPERGNPHPAGAVDVVLTLAVPMELDLHPSVLIDIDFLSGWAHHHGRLHPAHARRWRHARRPVRQRRRNAGEMVGIPVSAIHLVHRQRLPGIVLHAGDHVLAVVGVMPCQIEGMPPGETGVPSLAPDQQAG